MRHAWRIGFVFFSCLSLPVLAQETPEKKQDAVPSTFRGFIVEDQRFDKDDVRNRTNRMHCMVVENGLNPVCAVFTRQDPLRAADAPLGTLITQLNGLVEKYTAANAASFVLFLTLDGDYPADESRAARAADVKALAEEVKASSVPFGLASGTADPDKPGPLSKWKIGETDELVVVVYHKMQVIKRWSFDADNPPTAADIEAITKAFEEEAKKGA